MNTTDPAWELANAKAMAQKAIDLDPEFGPGYAMMAFAQILAGEREAAIANANQSVLIQPGDAFARVVARPLAALDRGREVLLVLPVTPDPLPEPAPEAAVVTEEPSAEDPAANDTDADS